MVLTRTLLFSAIFTTSIMQKNIKEDMKYVIDHRVIRIAVCSGVFHLIHYRVPDSTGDYSRNSILDRFSDQETERALLTLSSLFIIFERKIHVLLCRKSTWRCIMNRQLLIEMLVVMAIIMVVVIAIIIQRVVFGVDSATAVKHVLDGGKVTVKVINKVEQRRGN